MKTSQLTRQYDVGVVVVGMNAREFVRGCFASLARTDWRTYTHRAVYVDNGSTDGTVEMMREKFPEVLLVANDKNLGYCVAANQGARLVDARHLLFLNDDTVFSGDVIPILVEYMDANPEVATAGARLIFPDGKEQWSGRRWPNFASSFLGRRSGLSKVFPRLPTVQSYLCKQELSLGKPFDCDWVSAAGQIVRTPDFWSVGGFAEDYYYWHEMVICLRLKRRGRRVVLIPAATIIHFEGQGSGPRPFKRQQFHIVDFHRGAFRAYLEQHTLQWYSPRALLVGAALFARGTALLGLARLRTLFIPTLPAHAAPVFSPPIARGSNGK